MCPFSMAAQKKDHDSCAKRADEDLFGREREGKAAGELARSHVRGVFSPDALAVVASSGKSRRWIAGTRDG